MRLLLPVRLKTEVGLAQLRVLRNRKAGSPMVRMHKLEDLAAMAGRDDERVERVLRMARVFPETRGTAEQVLTALCASRGIDPFEELVFPLPLDLPSEGWMLGDVLAGERPFGAFRYPVEELPGNLGVFGVSGSGKSTLVRELCEGWIEQGVEVLLLDVQAEYGSLARRFPAERLGVVSARTFPLPLFENPVGSCLDDLARLAQVVGVLREVLYLRDGSCNLLLEVVGEMYRERGVLDGSRNYPLATEVFQKLVASKFSGQSRHAGYLETLVNRFQGLLQSFPGLNAKRSAPPEQVLSQSLIVQMANLSLAELDVFTALFLAYTATGLEGEIRDRTRLVMVLEEVHLLASRQKLSRMDLGEPLVVRLLRTGRKRGVSVLAADQVPSELCAGVLGNLATRVVFRLTNYPCIRAVSGSMGLHRGQSADIAELPRRRAVVQTGSVPKPFLLQVKEIPDVARPGREELAEREAATLAMLDYELSDVDVAEVLHGHKAGGKRKTPAREALNADAQKVLTRICEKPYEFIDERWQALEMERSREYRTRRALEKLGMIEVGEKIGAKLQLYVPTKKGIEWAEKRGLPIHRYKSSIGHERIVVDVRRGLEAWSGRVKVVSMGEGLGSVGIQPDLVVQVRDERTNRPRVVVVQVASKNKAGYEMEKASELLEVEQVDLVVLVARNKGMRDRLVGAAGKLGMDVAVDDGGAAGEGGRGGRFWLVDYETCVQGKYEWGRVLGDG